MVSKEIEKIEQGFLKEKGMFLERIKAVRAEKTKELEKTKLELDKLKKKQAVAQRNLDYVLKALSKFKIQAEDMLKQNLEHKKEIFDLKTLKSRIPKQIKDIQTKMKNNKRAIKAAKRDAKKISLRKTKVANSVKDINYLVQKYETVVINLTDATKELALKEKNLIDGKIVWAQKSAISDIGKFVKKYLMSSPPKRKAAKKKSAKKKPAKKKAVKRKAPKKKAKKRPARKAKKKR